MQIGTIYRLRLRFLLENTHWLQSTILNITTPDWKNAIEIWEIIKRRMSTPVNSDKTKKQSILEEIYHRRIPYEETDTLS